MNEKLIEVITPENITSYSSACMDLCYELLTLKEDNYKRLIIPSRGAYPFYKGALTSLQLLADSALDFIKFNSHFNLWLLPYTADWGNANISVNSKQIRKFWTKILADSIKKKSSLYTFFYNELVNKIGNRYTINTNDLLLDKFHKADDAQDEKFIFVDTAVSGRAICEIIDCFHDFNLKDYYIILFLDEDGNKLTSTSKAVIEKEKANGKLKQINVKRIFSEDASPLLNSGISSIVFPSLIERAFDEIKEFNQSGFVGGGLWFIDSIAHLRKFNRNLNAVRGTLDTLIYTGISHQITSKNFWFHEMIESEAEQMVKYLGGFNIFDKESTKGIVYDRIISKRANFNEEVQVSSSHVIRINMNDEIISKFIKGLKQKITIHKNN